MNQKLSRRRIAALVCDGFEQSELFEPRTALEDEGAHVDVVSSVHGRVKGWKHTDWGRFVKVDVQLGQANPRNYDALLLPGGVMNPDKLRLVPAAIDFIAAFVTADKPIAAICHGPWTLINAGAVRAKTLTSWPSLEVDLLNAGATWVDKEVVRDGKLVTSRKPADLPAFNRKMVEVFSEQPLRAIAAESGIGGESLRL
jgi:protease I